MRSFFLISAKLLLVLSLVQAEPVQARATKVIGEVDYAPPGGEFAPLSQGDRIPLGSTVRTGGDGKAVLLTVPGAAMRISPDSEVRIGKLEFTKGAQTDSRKARIILKSGTVSALIDKKTADVTDFRIKTPQGVAAARGTFFGVSVEDGKTFLTVKEGNVGVSRTKKKDE